MELNLGESGKKLKLFLLILLFLKKNSYFSWTLSVMQGDYDFSNKDRYEGDFNNGLKSGTDIFLHVDSSKYEGYW